MNILNEFTGVNFVVPDQMIGGAANNTTPFAGSSCLRIDSTLIGANLAVPLIDIPLTTNDFTAEMWFKDRLVAPTGERPLVSRPLVGSGINAYQWSISLVLDSSGRSVVRFSCVFVGASGPVTCSVQLLVGSYAGGVSDTLSPWSHLAAVRSGTKLGLFMNGVGALTDFALQLPATPSLVQPILASPVTIGGMFPNLGQGVVATRKEFLDELRITGSARYTANFVPLRNTFPRTCSAPGPVQTGMKFLMHFHGVEGGTTFTEEYGQVVTIQAGGSPLTTTTAQKLYGPSSGNFTGGFGLYCSYDAATFRFPGPFEIGARARYLSGSADLMNCRIYDNVEDGSWLFGCYGLNRLNSTGTQETAVVGGTPVVGAFAEYVVSRDALGVVRFFINGVMQSSATDTTVFGNTPHQPHIGDRNDHTGSGYFNGQIAELWIIPGQARHVANYTPTTVEIPFE